MRKPDFFQRPAIRVGLLLLVVILAFIIVQQLSIPKSFGAYGYYRGDNVQEWVNLPPTYSPFSEITCKACHGEIVTLKGEGPHTGVNCESCHLASAKHTQAPFDLKPPKNTTREACLACHDKQAARPETAVRQVDGSQHNFGMPCTNCHAAHSPWAKMGGKKP